MSAWIALGLGLPAFVALSMAMARHQEQVFGRELSLSAGRRWRIAGVLLLSAALTVCVARWQWSVGIAAWLGALTFAAVTVGLVLTYRPDRLLPLGGGALAIGVAAWLWQLVRQAGV